MIERQAIFAAYVWALAAFAAVAQPVAEAEFARPATWQQPKVADLRAEVLKWLDEEKPEADVRAKVLALWPAGAAEPAHTELLDRVAATLALADPRVQTIVEHCAKPRSEVKLPDFDWLAEDEMPAFARDNLQLIYGRWLVQNQLYDEGLVQLNGLDPKDVVDPASLLFYQAVAHHRLLDKEPGLQALARLLERRGELPRRFESLAELMTTDLEELDDESLDHIARRMDDIKRRLELARVGKTVRGVEDGVIASLDKLIDEMEKRRQQQMAMQAAGKGGNGRGGRSSGEPRGIQSSSPAQDSRAAQGKGAGDVDKKAIGNKSGWGDLPPKEREEALQQIGKDFPPHYREAIEQYFRRLASEGSERSEGGR